MGEGVIHIFVFNEVPFKTVFDDVIAFHRIRNRGTPNRNKTKYDIPLGKRVLCWHGILFMFYLMCFVSAGMFALCFFCLTITLHSLGEI